MRHEDIGITCRACGAEYQVAESTSVGGHTGHQECVACGANLAEWADGPLKAFRLEMSPQHGYAHVKVPLISVALK